MKAVLRHIGAICLSALVLFTTLSFRVDLHYCGKHLVDLAINKEAQGCVMSLGNFEDDSFSGHQQNTPCCEDVQLSFDGQEELQKATTKINLEPHFTVVLPRHCVSIPHNPYTGAKASYTDYVPPPIIRDVPILFQTFLI